MILPIIYNINSSQDIVDLIKGLRSFGSSIDYTEYDEFDNRRGTINNLYSKLLIDDNMENVEYVLNDIGSNIRGLINYMLENINRSNSDVLNLIIEKAFSTFETLNEDSEDSEDSDEDSNFSWKRNFSWMFEDTQSYRLFLKTRNDKLLNVILDRLVDFDPFEFTKNPKFMDILIKNMDREKFKDNLAVGTRIPSKKQLAFFLSKYDDAVKRRVTEVSLGLGYAQFNNQEQSIIPSLILQQIVDESADTSGIPAQDVYKIVKHVNEGITNDTIRLGQPSNLEDAKEEDIKIGRLGLPDNFEDAYDQDEVIEI